MRSQKTMKQKFSASEDTLLQGLVEKHGTSDWKLIAEFMPNRTSRQCRERWKYYLDPQLNSLSPTKWTREEDEKLIAKYYEYGPKWSQIAHFFPQRTDINLKNRFHRLERLRMRGISDHQSTDNSQSSDDETKKTGRMILALPVPLSQLYPPTTGFAICNK